VVFGDRAAHAGGRGFEPRPPRHQVKNKKYRFLPVFFRLYPMLFYKKSSFLNSINRTTQ